MQRYDNGYIVSGPNGAWESYGVTREKWAAQKYENGALGYPKGPVIESETEYSQAYDNGEIRVNK